MRPSREHAGTFTIVRTPAALLRQMSAHDRPLEDLELALAANEFACERVGTLFEVDGAPFMTHLVGTASAMVQLEAPAAAVAAALCHSVFSQGDWGDGRPPGVTADRVSQARDRLGDATTDYLLEFRLGLHGSPVAILARAEQLTELERWRILYRLSDLLEKWEDGGVMHAEGDRLDVSYTTGKEESLVSLARGLGGDEFGDALAEAYASATLVPSSLRLGRLNSVVVRPPSMMMRPSVRLQLAGRRVLGPWKAKLARRLRRR